jgi:TRAP-type C4-dicarboxylate transport system substrate-binding protein
MKTNAQFSAMRKGALDISLFPMPYAGGEVPELNIGLMPALVSSYEQAAKWKTAEVGRMLTKILEDKGIVLSHANTLVVPNNFDALMGVIKSRNLSLVTLNDAF